MRALSPEEISRTSHELRWQARTGTPLAKLMVPTYALVREVARRVLGMEMYPVQLLAGVSLFYGYTTEMQTGEGKTLTATLPVCLRGLSGQGVHVFTANEYLAQRDAEKLESLYDGLGLSVGCVLAATPPDQHRVACRRDVVYGTASEFGFDFLRDRLRMDAAGLRNWDVRKPHPALERDPLVQRGHYFALIDEADSILIDDARTPLIIALPQAADEAKVALFVWARDLAKTFTPGNEFEWEAKNRSTKLTPTGKRRVLLAAKPAFVQRFDNMQVYRHLELALRALHGYSRDRDYVVRVNKETKEFEVAIVDESTGRVMEGRKWQDGLHQAVEVKELLAPSDETGPAARITVQNYFRQYQYLAGMTGTAWLARSELSRVYGMGVIRIPTHRPCLRESLPTRIFATQAAKRTAIVQEIQKVVAQNRAVLVGTPSVSASEELGAALREAHVRHRVLNARHHAEEAAIVAEAGQPGRVTIATNMAGRGTDILLHRDVNAAGGLHVIATEFHTSPRIDRQLVGRSARQGDPGSFRFFLSLEDELLRNVDPRLVESWIEMAQPDACGELSAKSWLSLFTRLQNQIERRQVKDRKQLLRFEHQRHQTYVRMGLDPCLDLTEG